MNLSLTFNLPGSTAAILPGAAAPAQATLPPEMASFQDFLSVMGLAPMAIDPLAEEGVETTPDDTALTAANDTGNFLPPALAALPVPPVLPDLSALAAGLVPPQPIRQMATAESADSAGQSPQVALQASPIPVQLANMLAQAGPTATKGEPVAAAAPVLPTATQPAPTQPAPTQPAPTQPALAPALATLEIELLLPPATAPVAQTAQQVMAQPVIAQMLHAVPRQAARKASAEFDVASGPTAATVEVADQPRPAAAAPILPVAAPIAASAAAPEIPGGQPATATAAVTTTAAPERHDFSAVIDKLSEARELARPGRADMHLTHREFGQVSVQFELAGQALKVAMSSPDQAFAPAVQAALADRSITAVADAARADPNTPRADLVSASNAAWQAGPQADGQRGDGQSAARQPRAGGNQVQQHNDGDAAARGPLADRDGSRFA